MKEIRVLTAIFSKQISPKDISAFRGAVIAQVGLEEDLFHNHNNSDKAANYFYRYPLVQYQLRQQRPTLVFVEKAVEKANLFLRQTDVELNLNGNSYRADLKQLFIDRHSIGHVSQYHYYKVSNWIALNEKNFEKYQKEYSLVKRVQMLENVLAGHILALAEGLDFRFEKRFEVEISMINKESMASYNQVRVRTFDIQFRTNLLLPQQIGMGKGASRGFGILGS